MSHAQSTAHNHLSRDTKPVGVCHGCDALRALAATSPTVAAALSVLATVEPGNAEFVVVSRWGQLLEWVADDHECRAVEILVTVAGTSYVGGDRDEHRVTEFDYQIDATESFLDGTEYVNGTIPCTWAMHRANGPTIEAAADATLRMIADLWNHQAAKTSNVGPMADGVTS